MSIGAYSIGETAYTEELASLASGTVAVGTITSTSIAVSATAPTNGYQPYGPYQWAISPSGLNTWTNFGTNSLTGQTATGLTAATAYDIRIAQPDATGFTVYAYALGVSTAGGPYVSTFIVD